MNRSLKAAHISSLVMAVLLAACQSGSSASESAAPPSSPPVSASSSPEDATSVLSKPDTHHSGKPLEGVVGITVTVPATGWSDPDGGWAMEWGADGFDAPGGAGIIAFPGADKKFFVYGDPCAWRRTRPDVPATTVDEIVAALASQASRGASQPEKISVDGYPGKKITLHIPDDVVVRGGDQFKGCDNDSFATLGVAGEDPALGVQGQGEIDEVWVLDVNGSIVLLDGGYYPQTPQDTVDELHDILSSATFD
jgi:hypothetical protein